jgi:methylmalonyl-CoA/ethylmalonyl-CoA epimerase
VSLTPLRFDHAGYAVNSIERTLNSIVQPLFQPRHVGGIIEDPIQKVRVCFVSLVDDVRLELIEPLGPDSPISRLLTSGRGGLYHCCFIADQLDDQIAAFVARGYAIASKPQPATAYEGRRVAFLFGPDTGLVELVEATSLTAS